jgi:hypothetical protein
MDEHQPPHLQRDEDEAGLAWAEGIAREWAVDLGDTQDIYTIKDGSDPLVKKNPPNR